MGRYDIEIAAIRGRIKIKENERSVDEHQYLNKVEDVLSLYKKINLLQSQYIRELKNKIEEVE